MRVPHTGATMRALFFLGALDLADLPLGQILDAIGADAQLYDMNSH
jgi:hypothetical protein